MSSVYRKFPAGLTEIQMKFNSKANLVPKVDMQQTTPHPVSYESF
jgi:hypothetical protein